MCQNSVRANVVDRSGKSSWFANTKKYVIDKFAFVAREDKTAAIILAVTLGPEQKSFRHYGNSYLPR